MPRVDKGCVIVLYNFGGVSSEIQQIEIILKMDDGSDLLIAACGMFIAGSLQRERSCWVRPSLLSRNCYSNYDRLRDLKADDLIVQNLPYILKHS